MQWNWKQLAGAFVIGVLMPGLSFGSGGKAAPVVTQPPPTTQQSIHIVPLPEKSPIQIPVLMPDGSLEQVELEEYVAQVVLGEMPASFETEALKAQAVAARTYTLWCSRKMQKHPDGAVCTDFRCCQAYLTAEDYIKGGGSQEEIKKVISSAEQTAGQVATYGGELIEATYFSCSGGRTEDAVAVWGTDVPYLQSVASPGEEGAEPYTHTIRFTSGDFQRLLGRWLTGTPENWFGLTTYTEGGGVATTYIAGRSYSGVQLRQLLSLNSTAFTFFPDEEGVTVTTAGKGHRVGMSQYGADAMAAGGAGYAQILAYYYPGTRIDKMESVG